MALEDTYFHLLETSSQRQFGLCGERLQHRTPRFDPVHYARAAGETFADDEAAYRHWLRQGRRAGLSWARGQDTRLKIVLKAKDEPELIDAWVAHHAAIVGFDNLLILDTGSTDPDYLARLDAYRERLLVLDYRRDYDLIHATRANEDFYRLLGANARYLTILDADEFLMAYWDGILSRDAVLPMIDHGEPLYAATWIANLVAPTETDGVIDRRAPVPLDLDPGRLRAWTIAGKTIARTDTLPEISHLGHNLHVPDVMARMTPGSFGRLFVVHLQALPPALLQRRALKHLRGKGHVDAGVGETELAAIARDDTLPPTIRHYAQVAIDPPGAKGSSDGPLLDLFGGGSPLPELQAALGQIDFPALLAEARGA